MGQLEQQPHSNEYEHNNEVLQMARNLTQIQLAFEEGEELTSWIGKHSEDFDKLTQRNPHILDELAEKETHDEAIEKVKKEIYH